MYSKKGAAWVNETGKKEVTKQTVAYSPRSKLGTLLPEFPNVKDLNLPASLPEERVNRTFKSPSLLPTPPFPLHSSLHLWPPLAPAYYLTRDLRWVLHVERDPEDLYAGSWLTLNLLGGGDNKI